MDIIIDILTSSWELLGESSVYILFGLLVSGFLKVFLNPDMVARHLGQGRFSSVFKAALLGVPIPLCSCGVLPAALSLKKQGANNGATTAFMISTPESGVDSIAITYALLDPLMTVARPLVAFFTATVAGLAENLFGYRTTMQAIKPELHCTVDGCCDGIDCPPEAHRQHHPFGHKVMAGLRYAFGEFWGDLAGWFFLGIVLAGLITALIPDDIFSRYLGSGFPAMLMMLAVGIPLYICATASTPIAAALILKGVSPGAALVFLLAGPATNVASLTVLFGVLGKRAAAIYLAAIAACSIAFGLALDQVYAFWGLSAKAMAGQASEIIPLWLEWLSVSILLAISIKPVVAGIKSNIKGLIRRKSETPASVAECGDT
ncbi:MAG: SO_0444 family Cu/Zn efflux transporter [Desulfobacterales bacterium]|jgi:uncharacterized membrane protein YraQ (UPF0718 family)